MTTDELIEWHTRRIGAKLKYEPDTGLYMLLDKNGIAFDENPFPATLDGADASMPPGYQWIRVCRAGGTYEWIAQKYHGIRSAACNDTGDKIHDLYALSKLTWEQEAA